MTGVYDVFHDPYLYKRTNILKNRAGLRDGALLEAFELEMTTLRADEPLPDGGFDPAHYRAVHRHLFQDVYGWAGRYRTVRIAKDGHMFCYPEHISRSMDELFARLHGGPFTGGAGFAEFARAAAHFLGELNAIHPFREGNGRTQLSFLHLVAHRAGHPLDLAKVSRGVMLPAMIASFGGDTETLVRAVEKLSG